MSIGRVHTAHIIAVGHIFGAPSSTGHATEKSPVARAFVLVEVLAALRRVFGHLGVNQLAARVGEQRRAAVVAIFDDKPFRVPLTERPLDLSDQETVFGSLLGSMPTRRAKTNGVVVYKGYVVAEFGDTAAVDPTYSVAKSMLATVAGVALRDGRIASLDQPVAATVKDGGYASPRNAAVTWKMHLQQEWQGEMFGKKDDFIGAAQFGKGERKPRELKQPGGFYDYIHKKV